MLLWEDTVVNCHSLIYHTRLNHFSEHLSSSEVALTCCSMYFPETTRLFLKRVLHCSIIHMVTICTFHTHIQKTSDISKGFRSASFAKSCISPSSQQTHSHRDILRSTNHTVGQNPHLRKNRNPTVVRILIFYTLTSSPQCTCANIVTAHSRSHDPQCTTHPRMLVP